MTDQVVEVLEQPELHDPVLVVMLQGWIDASGAALAAMAALESDTKARTIARFDRDTFIDYRARRPIMELRDGVNTRLVWPEIELKAGRDGDGKDVLLLTGHEPDAAWSRFADAACSLSAELGVRMMVGLGAYPFAAPHSRPARLSCTAPDEQLLATLDFVKSSVDVPAGVEAALEHAFHDRGIPSLGIWAQVPHYVSGMSYPAASAALITGLHDATGVTIDTSSLRSEALLQRTRLDELVAGNDEHRSMVRQLEQIYDAQQAADDTSSLHPSNHGPGAPLDAGELPSVDELAAEVERYLRDQGSE
ncbi:MAG: proteasome assembly chaperone family protein [Acidimicrobiia bacterium]